MHAPAVTDYFRNKLGDQGIVFPGLKRDKLTTKDALIDTAKPELWQLTKRIRLALGYLSQKDFADSELLGNTPAFVSRSEREKNTDSTQIYAEDVLARFARHGGISLPYILSVKNMYREDRSKCSDQKGREPDLDEKVTAFYDLIFSSVYNSLMVNSDPAEIDAICQTPKSVDTAILRFTLRPSILRKIEQTLGEKNQVLTARDIFKIPADSKFQCSWYKDIAARISEGRGFGYIINSISDTLGMNREQLAQELRVNPASLYHKDGANTAPGRDLVLAIAKKYKIHPFFMFSLVDVFSSEDEDVTKFYLSVFANMIKHIEGANVNSEVHDRQRNFHDLLYKAADFEQGGKKVDKSLFKEFLHYNELFLIIRKLLFKDQPGFLRCLEEDTGLELSITAICRTESRGALLYDNKSHIIFEWALKKITEVAGGVESLSEEYNKLMREDPVLLQGAKPSFDVFLAQIEKHNVEHLLAFERTKTQPAAEKAAKALEDELNFGSKYTGHIGGREITVQSVVNDINTIKDLEGLASLGMVVAARIQKVCEDMLKK